MLNPKVQFAIIQQLVELIRRGHKVIVTHGGGPYIKRDLEEAGIKSEFIEGQRVTTPDAMRLVERTLKGEVNGNVVSMFLAQGLKAVGISGKDGKMILGKRRIHTSSENGKTTKLSLGQVADVERVDTRLIRMLIEQDYVPVVACIATDDEGHTYNVNADMLAGHLAGALKADQFIVMTDVDGLLENVEDPSSVIRRLSLRELSDLLATGKISGGMIPKLEACQIALQRGCAMARIINGTNAEQLSQLLDKYPIGTTVHKN